MVLLILIAHINLNLMSWLHKANVQDNPKTLKERSSPVLFLALSPAACLCLIDSQTAVLDYGFVRFYLLQHINKSSHISGQLPVLRRWRERGRAGNYAHAPLTSEKIKDIQRKHRIALIFFYSNYIFFVKISTTFLLFIQSTFKILP